jgi:nicotinamidase-related amidase
MIARLAHTALILCWITSCVYAALPPDAEVFHINARSRIAVPDNKGQFKVLSARENWDPAHTAIVVCDMWDQHWCAGATRRVAQMAARMNAVISRARQAGVLIVHAPSGVLTPYHNHPAYLRGQAESETIDLPEGIQQWCQGLESEDKTLWPIDQSDGGCDDHPACKQGSPWRRQVDSISIADSDLISDSGEVIWRVFARRNIENVILMGVHTNMCVIGRPFGLRNMKRAGKNVVLCRDLTDTMYNSRMKPWVNHFSGTDLIVEYIERYVCPTILSTDITGQAPYRFPGDKRSRVVFLAAEGEYGSNQTLPALAHELTIKYGLSCELLQGLAQRKGPDRNYLPNMQALAHADLVVLFARRRALPETQMQQLRDYLGRKKPLIAIRTSSHAFALRGAQAPEGYAQWPDFDNEVLGCDYNGYPHGETKAYVAPEARSHPVMQGIRGPFQIRETMYRSSPLGPNCQVLMQGQCVSGAGDDRRYHVNPDKPEPPQPVAWINDYHGARIFSTSMGSDQAAFKQDWYRQMLTNAIFWALDRPVPENSK